MVNEANAVEIWSAKPSRAKYPICVLRPFISSGEPCGWWFSTRFDGRHMSDEEALDLVRRHEALGHRVAGELKGTR